jgi:protocatechuate 3,4-dioxygenase beta subunit
MGQVLHVSGRVLNRDGMPVPNAKLDIWQANSFGRYRHPVTGTPRRSTRISVALPNWPLMQMAAIGSSPSSLVPIR